MKKELLFFEYNEVIFIRGSRIIKFIIKSFIIVFKYKLINNIDNMIVRNKFFDIIKIII